MKRYEFAEFGIDKLQLSEVPTPEPGPGEVRVGVRARSLNFRDVLVVSGHYDPRLALPATPLSDGAGVVEAVGADVVDWEVGDEVVGHFVSDWQDGPYEGRYLATTLGTPGAGMAAEQVVLPAHAILRKPAALDFAQAATLPIAALTAWSALFTEGALKPGQTVLTLGTGGVSIFALQLAKAHGARVIVTSSSDEKLERVRELGADGTVQYLRQPDWDKVVRKEFGGADVVVENGGAGTLSQSLRAVKPGGVIGMLGALTGLKAEVDISPVLMKRVRIAGIMVDCKAAFADLLAFVSAHGLEPVIDARFGFEELPAALAHMKSGKHFGKIVVE